MSNRIQLIRSRWVKKWQQLPANDQRALSVLFLILGPLMIWWLLISPVLSARESVRQELESRSELLDWLKMNGPAARTAAAASAANSGSETISQGDQDELTSMAIRYARQQGLVLQKFEMSPGNGLRIWFDDVPYASFLTLLAQLEAEQQVSLTSGVIERTDRDGAVNVRGVLGYIPD